MGGNGRNGAPQAGHHLEDCRDGGATRTIRHADPQLLTDQGAFSQVVVLTGFQFYLPTPCLFRLDASRIGFVERGYRHHEHVVQIADADPGVRQSKQR